MKKILLLALPLFVTGCVTTDAETDSVVTEKAGYYEELPQAEVVNYQNVDDIFEGEESYPSPTQSAGTAAYKSLFDEGKYSQINMQELEDMGVDLSVLNEPVVNFEYDSYEISEGMEVLISKHALLLNSVPEIKVLLEGHTDSRGDRAYNLKLGEQRAIAIRDHMSRVHQIDPNRIELISFGEEKPLSKGYTESDHSKNRRAEFKYE